MTGSDNNSSVNEDKIKLVENRVLRLILLISGFILIAIGILGMFLPLLPTTVFLLLAAWCFARSSEHFYRWVHYNWLFGKYIRDYQSGNGMTIKAKIFSIAFLGIGIGASAFWMTESFYVRLLLAIIAIGVTWHIIVIKTNTGS